MKAIYSGHFQIICMKHWILIIQVTKDKLLEAIEGHVLAEAELMAVFWGTSDPLES